MTRALEDKASRAVAFFDTEGRASLKALETVDIGEIDAAADVLRRAVALQSSVRVGFLGESQVGKSSIINALVGQRVLPSGGVGPLTAQATALSFADAPSFHVKYHGRKRLNEFRFALQRYLQSIGELTSHEEEGAREPSAEGEDESFQAHVFDPASEGEETGHDEEQRRVGEYLVSQARLMLALPLETSRSEVFQLVRAIANKAEPPGELTRDAALRERILHIRRLLDTSEEVTKARAANDFPKLLRLRAAGWMSPLVAELHVSLDLPLLAEVELVDLPGIGVIGDPAGRIAEEFVAKDADALVIVMRNNGLTEHVAELLERTGVISRLLWNAEAQDPKVHVAVAVTRLDDVAKDTWRQRALEARELGTPLPRREEIFRELAEPMAATVKRQVAEALQASRELEDLPADLRAHREAVVRALCEQMTVLCVSAPDYLGIVEGFEDDCFLRVKEDTNIPRLAEQLTELSSRARQYRESRLSDGYLAFTSALSRAISHQEQVRRPRKHAKSDADHRFREAVRLAAKPLKADAARHRDEFLAMLDEAIPRRLEEVSNKAAEHARKRLQKLKQSGSKVAWQTLNAALVRSGKFRGAHTVDYPGSLTRAFVDVIAGTWEPTVVREVRVAYQGLCDADATIIDALVSRVTELVRTDEVDAKLRDLRKQIREQGQVSVTWTQAQLDELGEDVRKKLMTVVGPPIEKACRAAQKAGVNYGRKARNRILDVFEEGGREAIERAREETVLVLDDHVKRLRRSLAGVLKESYDPVTRALETIIEVQGEALAKLDEERRQKQLAAIRGLREKLRQIETGTLRASVTSEGQESVTSEGKSASHATSANVRTVGQGIFDDL